MQIRSCVLFFLFLFWGVANFVQCNVQRYSTTQKFDSKISENLFRVPSHQWCASCPFQGHFGASISAHFWKFIEAIWVGIVADLSAGALHAYPATRQPSFLAAGGRPVEGSKTRWLFHKNVGMLFHPHQKVKDCWSKCLPHHCDYLKTFPWRLWGWSSTSFGTSSAWPCCKNPDFRCDVAHRSESNDETVV